MKKTLSILMALVLALSMCAMTMTAFAATSDMQVNLSANVASAKVGDIVTVTVSAVPDSKAGIGALDFTIQYDTSAFEYVAGSFTDAQYFGMASLNDGVPGQLIYSATQEKAITASGTVATAQFKVLKTAQTIKLDMSKGVGLGDYDSTLVTDSVIANSTTSVTVACAHANTSSNVTTAPSCDIAGVKTVVCNDCGEVLGTESIPATGHNFGAWSVVKEATCAEEGVEERVCADCGERETRPIAKTAHTPGEWVVTKEPTCTEDGEKVQKCTVCDVVLATEVIPALGHSVADDAWTITKEPTCTEDGEKEGVCEVCGETVVEVIPALGHTVADDAWTITKEPTCTEDGEKEGVCEVCGETAVEAIPALGHDFGEWVVVKEATETEEGLKERVCAVCGEKETEVIPKLTAEGVTGDTDAPSIPKTSGAVIGGVASLAMLSMAAGVAVVTMKKKREEDK